MKIQLKSNQYYDFFKIRKIYVDGNNIKIEGNFEKNKRFKTVEIKFGMIEKSSLKNLKSYMKDIMKRFDFDGKCPDCYSYNVWMIQKQTHKKELNKPKPKFIDVKVEDVNCKCQCGKIFNKDRLMYSNIVLYYN